MSWAFYEVASFHQFDIIFKEPRIKVDSCARNVGAKIASEPPYAASAKTHYLYKFPGGKPLKLKEISIDHDLVSQDELQPFEGVSEHRLFQVLKRQFHIQESYLLELISSHYGWPLTQKDALLIDEGLQSEFDRDYCRSEGFIPLFQDEQSLFIASYNPFCIPELSQQLGLPVEGCLISENDFESLIDSDTKHEDSIKTLLDNLLKDAVSQGASDIHIYSGQEQVTVYLRLDGEMQFYRHYPSELQSPLITMIKLKADMDISTYTRPQDGFISIHTDVRHIQGRISSIPSAFGEDIVIRLFQNHQNLNYLEQLSIPAAQVRSMQSALEAKQGVFLVTGPTGSGKSTTLYSCLRYLQTQRNANIVSLEDPIERVIPGVRQCPINTESHFDFASGLRAILRQDPDIILIGEIRDEETAKIVFEAAYTGHLVLSSLHTGDVESSLLRLASFDVDPFLVSQALRGILSQDLVLDPQTGRRKISSEYLHISERMPSEIPITNTAEWIRRNPYFPRAQS
mgnify:CR=1 FL=1